MFVPSPLNFSSSSFNQILHQESFLASHCRHFKGISTHKFPGNVAVTGEEEKQVDMQILTKSPVQHTAEKFRKLTSLFYRNILFESSKILWISEAITSFFCVSHLGEIVDTLEILMFRVKFLSLSSGYNLKRGEFLTSVEEDFNLLSINSLFSRCYGINYNYNVLF